MAASKHCSHFICCDLAVLPGQGADHGVHNTGEFHQEPVSHQLNDTSTVVADERFEKVSPQAAHAAKRPDLVGPHQSCVADHIGGQDSGKFAFQVFSPLSWRLATKDRRIHAKRFVVE